MGFKGNVGTWDDNEGVDIPGATLRLATSVYSRINNYCDTIGDRNTLVAGMSTAEKLATRVWIDQRKGWCTFDGTNWLWEPQRNLIYKGYNASAVDTNISTPGSLGVDMLSGYVLPGSGNRRVHVMWGAVFKNTSNPANLVLPRVTPLGAGGTNIGIPDGRSYAQAIMYPSTGAGTAASGFTEQASNQAIVLINGTVQIKLFGLNANGTASSNNANAVQFLHSWMQVYDLGPADD
jgi:hypothetical protein